jgi:hypothetical protein
MKELALVVLAVALSGCSTISDMFPSVKNKVAALESAYTSAAGFESAYLDPKVPFCTGNGVKLCKTKSTVIQVLAADTTAYLAIKAARGAEDENAYQAAMSAERAFEAVVSKLPTTNKSAP